MQKTIYYLVSIIILGSFVLITNSGDFLRKPTSDNNDVSLHIKNLEKDILDENWDEANDNYNKLKKAWEEVVVKIQFSVEKDEINYINLNLARLEAYLKLEEEDEALAELYEMKEHWNNLNN